MGILKEFREFAVRGNVVDMGVGIVIGAAFTSVVNSLVKDIFTPVIAFFSTGIDASEWFFILKPGERGGPYVSYAQAQSDNAIAINLGSFCSAVISFLVAAGVLFMVIRLINRLKRPEKVTVDPVETKECPHCFSTIALKATRCPCCTSALPSDS